VLDVLVFDEAQILTEAALDDMVPATNQAPNPLILFTGTPPKPSDPGEVFAMKRREALAGGSDDTVYIEFSADRGADPDDRKQWAKANPSYPRRTPPAAMLRMKKNLTAESFLREGLGIWDAVGSAGPFDLASWAACRDRLAKRVGPVSFAVEVAVDQASASIAVCGAVPDGRPRVALVATGRGDRWVVKHCVDIGVTEVALDAHGPAGALIADFEAAGVTVVVAGTRDVAQACGLLQSMIQGKALVNIGDGPLDAAVKAARKRNLGDGPWLIGRSASGEDVSPIQAVNLALWLWTTQQTGGPNLW
jgi:phage terminase large subunit-like protein